MPTCIQLLLTLIPSLLSSGLIRAKKKEEEEEKEEEKQKGVQVKNLSDPHLLGSESIENRG